jgi:repressor LexA
MNRIKEVLEEKGVKQTWLAERLEKSYNMINAYVQNRRQPSLDDLYKIARILGIDVRDLLDEDAFNRKEGVKAIDESGNDLVIPTKTVFIPLLGSIACGAPILATENIETEIAVSVDLLKGSNPHFLLRAKGNSMDEVGISDGDLVLIKQQYTAENGDFVVALIDDDATIKEFHKNSDAIVLKPRSTEQIHQPIILTRDFRIQGIVVATIPFL